MERIMLNIPISGFLKTKFCISEIKPGFTYANKTKACPVKRKYVCSEQMINRYSKCVYFQKM